MARHCAVRSALLLSSLFLIAASAVASSVAAADPPGPAVCTVNSQQVMVYLDLYQSGAAGRNLLSVPLRGPVQSTPNDMTQNGFHVLCSMMGIDGTTDIDGDGLAENAEIIQYDPEAGTVNSYWCHQPIASSAWLPNQGVEVRPYLTNSAWLTITWDWPECTQSYAAYGWGRGHGIQIVPIPVPWFGSNELDICAQYNLPGTSLFPGTKVQRIEAATGIVYDFYCGQLLSPYPAIIPGEGAFVAPDRTLVPGTNPGDPLNCAAPSAPPVCPPTPCPCHIYPCPLNTVGTAPWYCTY